MNNNLRFVVLIGFLCLAAPIHAAQMIGVTGGQYTDPSSVVAIDSNTAATVVLNDIGALYSGRGLSGVAVNSQGRAFAVTGPTRTDPNAFLLELDPVSGAVINEVGVLLNGAGQTGTIGDLAFQPGTGVLFGITSNGRNENFGPSLSGGYLLTIDINTALVTIIGKDPSTSNDNGGLAFAPDGTLYFVSGWDARGLYVVDPATGHFLSNVATSSRTMGLAINPQGVLYGTSNRSNPAPLHTIDPATGAVTTVGDMGGRFVHDIDFLPDTAPIARFNVTKTFSDNSKDDVDVTLTCTTGLPLTQTATITGGDPTGVTFVVTDLQGSVNCEVTESGGPAGYTPILNSGTGCTWSNVVSSINICEISNQANPGTFTVWKEWIILNDGGDAVEQNVSVRISCDRPIAGAPGSGPFWSKSGLVGDGGHLTAVVETTTGSASCWASESNTDSGVEATDNCGGLRTIPAGGSFSCTFTNTVFFEGIPTLSQYGLALMALLMLGVGMVGFRRFV